MLEALGTAEQALPAPKGNSRAILKTQPISFPGL